MTSTAEATLARKVKEEVAYQDFLGKPETKILLSMVPAFEPPELMQTLMRSAFDAGSAQGTVSVMMELIGAMFADRKSGGAQ